MDQNVIRGRALLDAPGPSDGAIWTSITGLAAIAVLLFRAGRRLLQD